MTLASSIFLAGLTAVAVPIAIHLLARQRTRVLPWGAMDFLRQSVSSATARRNRLRDLLLLLLRILAIVLLVLAFSQPFISRMLFGGQQLETIFVWDISLSTTALDSQGQPIQSAMKARLLEELARLPDNSSVRILIAGADSRWIKPDALPLSSTNRQALARAVNEQQMSAGESRLANGVLRAFSLEDDENAPVPFRDVVVLHDFQQRAWQPEATEQWKLIQQRIAEDPRWSLRSLDLDAALDDRLPQVIVAKLDVDRDTLAPESPARMRATIRNDSADISAQGDIVWRVDGREVERSKAIELEPAAELKIEQVVRFENTGCHQVECEFEIDRDLLPGDNSAVCAVATRQALPVLVIDDTERTQRGQIRPSEFIVAALGGAIDKPATQQTPSLPVAQPGGTSLFAPRVISSSDWQQEALEGQVAVFLVAAKQLPDAAIAPLQQFVRQGGGLWFILDPRQALPEWGVSLLTGLGLEPLTETTQATVSAQNRPYTVRVANSKSSFAAGIVSQNLDLFRTEVRSIQQLNRPVVLDEERLLETPAGLPVLLSLRVGLGRVLLQTTDLGRRNTNLPILQSFVPFTREVARETAGTSISTRNLDPGDVFQIAATSTENLLGGPALALPDGTTRQLRRNGAIYQSLDTLQPGIYQLFSSQTGKPDTAEEIFTVRRPAEESRLQRLTPARVTALLQPQMTDQDVVDRQVRGKWPLAFWLAVAAALCFLFEALLARSIAKQRTQRTSRIDLRPVY